MKKSLTQEQGYNNSLPSNLPRPIASKVSCLPTSLNWESAKLPQYLLETDQLFLQRKKTASSLWHSPSVKSCCCLPCSPAAAAAEAMTFSPACMFSIGHAISQHYVAEVQEQTSKAE
ncbi:hypothetical protein AV530_004312 [Patagioenas fasciata monilis]|uniref:Uncharacterized protein n=1 Tax=Patagioenas fasciata monilis TaxID=372326 RepID=A0A1V4K935_PATFA|nr:hypothetical protein AV530_004312 [Patagioenas fasciata monilis]